MKLDVEVNEIVLSNVTSTGEFRIRNSAKAFKILSDGLYSNKIRAVIRELSCNAVDSHVGAGKQDIPFEVHLPTSLEPWFSVQDFGLGLDGNQVENIYTTYFESTKTDSNDYIGALGLGSKSPFSYTENFTVTAVKTGIKRIYSAFINENGVPSIAEMSQELTDEVNGVEVKFSVTDRYDYTSFQYEAIEVFTYFKNKPLITGVKIEIPEPVYKEKNIVPGVHLFAKFKNSIAVMGNIAYPLGKISEPEKHFGDLAKLLPCGLVLEFDIGELDFAASREELSYVTLTLTSIKKKLENLSQSLISHFSAKADAIKDEWARAELLYTEARSNLYANSVAMYVAQTKFPLYDPLSYYGKKIFKLSLADLSASKLSISAFSSNHGRRHKIENNSEYINGNRVSYVAVPVESSVIIVLNDLKTGCAARAAYHFSQQTSGNYTVYCVSHESDDASVRQTEYDKLLKQLHNPPTVIKASQLLKREPIKREPLSNVGIAMYVPKVKTTNNRSNYDTYKWVPYTGILDDTTLYYYVCLSNFESESLDGKKFDVHNLQALMNTSGIDDIKNIVIMGVRKSRIKELKGRANWIWIEDKLREETAKVSDSHITAMVASNILDHWSTTPYTNKSVARQVNSNSDYAKFANKCNSIVRTRGDVANLVALCKQYGKTVQVDLITKSLEDAKTLIKAKYPLIRHLSNATTEEIAGYVNLIDSQPIV